MSLFSVQIQQIYGWVGDTRSNFRRDFRLAGVRDNENGAFLFPDFPELPEGYPDVNPACPGSPDDCQSTAFERVPDREQDFKMHFEPIDCENDPYVDELACEYFKNITGESFDAEKQTFDDKAFIRLIEFALHLKPLDKSLATGPILAGANARPRRRRQLSNPTKSLAPRHGTSSR